MHTFFLPESAKVMSEVTQNAQFILRDLIKNERHNDFHKMLSYTKWP